MCSNTNPITDICTLQFIRKLRNPLARRAVEQPSHYPVPVPAGYPATSGSDQILKNLHLIHRYWKKAVLGS